MEQVFEGVFRERGNFYTLSLFPGFRVHKERVVLSKGKEYRAWSHYHSKLSAALAKGMKVFPFAKGQKVLYLGAAQGVTPSFVSDIVGAEGEVYCVEISARAMRDLIFVCEKRKNLLPILADAKKPEEYAKDVGKVDVVYEDVASKDQAQILLRNCELLKKGGLACIAVKARSIDSAADPQKIYSDVLKELSSLELVEKIVLDPYERDHLFAVFRKVK